MTLTVGNALSTALSLYRARFAEFLGVSTRAVAWASTPFLVLLCGGAIIAALAFSAAPTNPQGVLLGAAGFGVLLVIICLALAVFCGAKGFTSEALIARLGFLDLAERPETVKGGWQQIRRRMWHVWLARIMTGIIVGMGSYGVSLLSAFAVTLLTLILGEVVFARLVGNVIDLLGSIVQLWLSARFLMSDVLVAVEQIAGDEAMTRSWNLTKGKDLAIMAIIFAASLAIFPAFVACFLPLIWFLVANRALFQAIGDNNNLDAASQYLYLWRDAIAPGIIWLTLSIILSVCLTILYTPFWQCLRATIYRSLTANVR